MVQRRSVACPSYKGEMVWHWFQSSAQLAGRGLRKCGNWLPQGTRCALCRAALIRIWDRPTPTSKLGRSISPIRRPSFQRLKVLMRCFSPTPCKCAHRGPNWPGCWGRRASRLASSASSGTPRPGFPTNRARPLPMPTTPPRSTRCGGRACLPPCSARCCSWTIC